MRTAFPLLLLCTVAVALGVAALALLAAPAVPQADAEALRARAAYVGSARCKGCHGDHYASWFATYHRSMTAPADSAHVLGAFDGRELSYGGVHAKLERDARDDSYTMRVSAPGQPSRTTPVSRTVGSHRYQQYLGERDGEWERLPVAWDVGEQRFVHMNTLFLTPDAELDVTTGAISLTDYDRHVTRWNDNCIYCHNTAPAPGLDPRSGAFDTHVAELGIACEACHGPGAEHVRRNHNPVYRYLSHLGTRTDRSVANPARMTSERASQVCGRCHGQRISPDIARVHQLGDRYVPGEDLRRYSQPLAHDTTLNGEHGVFADRFWADGTPRLTAYEYQGLLLSPCHIEGELQCESCHAMHGDEPNLQPRAGRTGDAACVGCHAELANEGARARHSRHDATGPGARCNACHMPNIVYGLAGARISHRIEVPNPAAHAAQGRPDACTLCHLDRSQAWAAAEVARLWNHNGAGTATPPSTDPLATWAASRLFGGDPIERATAAAALGAEHPAPGLSLAAREGLLLEAMRGDRYPAVRKIAWRSLQALSRRGSREATGAERGLAHAERDAPSHATLAPDAFDPADFADAREQRIAALRRTLPDAAQPDPAGVATLRDRASEHAIFIGE